MFSAIYETVKYSTAQNYINNFRAVVAFQEVQT